MVDFPVLGLTLLLSIEFCRVEFFCGFAKHVQATAKTQEGISRGTKVSTVLQDCRVDQSE